VHEQFIKELQFYDFNIHVTKNSTSEQNFSFYHSMKLLINITIRVQPIILCMNSHVHAPNVSDQSNATLFAKNRHLISVIITTP
jgi:hypothetical protein